MSRSGSARSWLYSWGGNSPEAAEIESNLGDQLLDGDLNTGNSAESIDGPEIQTSQRDVSKSVSPEQAETNMKQLPKISDIPEESPRITPPKPANVQAQTKASKDLKRKSSAASLSSYAPSAWLGWTTKTTRSYSVPERASDQIFSQNQRPSSTGSESTIDEEQSVVEEVYVDGKNNSQILSSAQSDDSFKGSVTSNNSGIDSVARKSEDGSISEADNRKKPWSFWNSAEDTAAKKESSPNSRITNTILKSTPSFPSRNDLRNKPDASKESAADNGSGQSLKDGPSKPDDAVLYKPHHSAKEFSKINTHKNQNLTENILVPDWDTCLEIQDTTSHSSTTSNLFATPGIRVSQAFDLKYWKSYLSNIPARLGLTSSANDHLNQEVGGIFGSSSDDSLHLPHERSYKLYGKSLSRLPHHKRACLPNPDKYYTSQHSGHLSGVKRQKTQLEEDATSKNSVSITNDHAVNLLINDHSSHDDVQQSSDIHTKRVGNLRKISKILIIGVHGFFPTRMIRPIIGSPKGTSSKFANEAEKSVIRYLVENNMMSNDESDDVSIQKIALEKEGKIFDRVDFFLKILTKWEKELNEADFVFVAAHSQGCVVSIILLSQLIKRGILKRASQKRIGILGMAGVNNGPFYGIDKSLFMKAYSAIEHESMIELFELTKFDSPQSIAYKDAMKIIVGANVKICFVGSINDQLVPLYSALASHVFHPNIYRACYIDSSARTPAFIQKLISFCCQLQNMGYFDNSVIKEISPILAGPLTGGGHSKIYNDGKVYDLGIKFMLDTDDLVIPKNVEFLESTSEEEQNLPVTNRVYVKEYNVGKIGTNPFILPWCLRGLIFNVQKNWKPLNQDSASKSAEDVIRQFYELFDQWRPETKALKDLKFRLNGIRASKL